MCGIFGVIGVADAPQKVFAGLKDIEYRGYDSWGVAWWGVEGGKWKVEKKIGFLPEKIPKQVRDDNGKNGDDYTVAMGHTRWATHGGVTQKNAHPHLDCTGKIVLVHNGIVENYREIKKGLKNHKFRSETDSEIIAHAIEESVDQGLSLKKAVLSVFKKMEGLNAIVVSNGQEIVAAKNGSPLVVGQVPEGFILASDPNALLPLTNKLYFVEDGEMVTLGDSAYVYSSNVVRSKEQDSPRFTRTISKASRSHFVRTIIPFTVVEWQHTEGKLSGFKHFMLQEIFEQPQVISRIANSPNQIKKLTKLIRNARGTYLIGCGTAGYAGLAGTYLFSEFAKKHVNFALGSEFNYLENFVGPKSLVIGVSQSGETIDTLEPILAAKKRGANIVALTNVVGSTLYRTANESFYLQAGIEKGVASTKAMMAMLSTLIMLAADTGGQIGLGEKILRKSAKEVERIIKNKDQISKLASKIVKSEHIYVLGRGLSYPVALESALKIKEISYIHAEGFAAGELKHGVIALIEKGTPVIVFVPEDETRGAVMSNAMEVKARGAYVIGVAEKPDSIFDFHFAIANVGASSILPNIVFAQLLAYFLAVKKGYNPDKPRNLAKSVVVR